MKAVILDGYTTNPGDSSWSRLESLCELTVYDRTPENLIEQRCNGCEIILTNKTPLRKSILEKLNNLKYIGMLSTGFNVVDVQYCKENNIPVCNVPTYSTNAVSQLTFAFILEFCNQVGIHNSAVHNNEWVNSKDFCFWKTPLTELYGKTLGIIGFGKIGKAVANIAEGFGMRICAVTNHPQEYKKVIFTDIDTLLSNSDFVSVHTPLTDKTEKMVNSEFLNKMKNTAFLINTSRGQVIDENALADALNNNIIAGAGLDVLSSEPPKADNPLLSCKNCFITPHIAWAGYEARQRLIEILTDNVESFINGKVQNNVW